MKQELVRLSSTDNIEMVGILYTPEEKSNKIVIHVHGLCGNFYENRFLDTLAKTYTGSNYENFSKWIIANVGPTQKNQVKQTAMIVYDRVLSDIEVIDTVDFFKTLEVK